MATLNRDRDNFWAAAYAEYVRSKHWWLHDRFLEADIWTQIAQERLADRDEVAITEAFELYFPEEAIDDRAKPRQISQQDQRRMAKCLLAAGFERNGKFTSGKQRNQARFNRASDS